MATFTLDGLDEWIGDLERAGETIGARVRPVVREAAWAVKTRMQADVSRSKHFRRLTGSVSFDTTYSDSAAEAEIGPVKGSSGSLANIMYFGGANGGGGTVADPQTALDAEAGAFVAALLAQADV